MPQNAKSALLSVINRDIDSCGKAICAVSRRRSASTAGKLIKTHVPHPEQLLILIEATGIAPSQLVGRTDPCWLCRSGDQSADRTAALHGLENSIRDNKTDAIDARGLCTIAHCMVRRLLALYRFGLKPEQFALQRLQGVRKALRRSSNQFEKDLPKSGGAELS